MRDDGNLGLFVSGAGPRGPLIDEPPPASVSAPVVFSVAANSSCPRVDVTLVEVRPSVETRAVKLGDLTIFVRRNAITTTSDISEFKVAGDDLDAVIRITYEPDAAARLQDATTDRDGLQLAFVVDDDVWLAFTWRGPYGIGSDGTQLSIRNGLAKAQQLLELLRSCSDTPTR
jgi:preprotein translocase subunit SecD